MKKSVVVYIHIFFWIALLAIKIISATLVNLSTEEYGEIAFFFATFKLFLPPTFFYIGYLAIMKIRWERKYFLLSALGIVSTYLILFLLSKKVFAFAINPIPEIYFWTTIGCLFRFFIDWFKKKNDVIILEKENMISNLALLKSQINPHFLFNTLHNIDTLIYDNQEKASKSLVMLSDIMRYMLTDAKSDFVELQKELEHIEYYLFLEKLRLKNDKFLNYSIKGDYKGIKIAPMIMIPFIENAFKHSVDSHIENGIVIKIRIVNKILSFVCENQFDHTEIDKDKVHGIGLETVKKRLDLIYKNRYKLSINSDNPVFKVNLEIDLNEN